MTKTIDFTAETANGWTVAAMIGERVVRFHRFDVADASELTRAQVWAMKNEVAACPEMGAAEEAFHAMDMDADEDELDAACPRVVFGMVSGGRFTFDMSKGDLARAGAKHLA